MQVLPATLRSENYPFSNGRAFIKLKVPVKAFIRTWARLPQDILGELRNRNNKHKRNNKNEYILGGGSSSPTRPELAVHKALITAFTRAPEAVWALVAWTRVPQEILGELGTG